MAVRGQQYRPPLRMDGKLSNSRIEEWLFRHRYSVDEKAARFEGLSFDVFQLTRHAILSAQVASILRACDGAQPHRAGSLTRAEQGTGP